MILDYTLIEFFTITKGLTLIVVGYILAKILTKMSDKFTAKHATPQQTMILRKIIFSTIFIIFIVAALEQFGFQLSVLLGSVGIVTAAIGFASQTSMSNLISGLFLILEEAFVVGDTIKFKDITGVVESIDLLSVKVCTFENTLVRIPNSLIISHELTNQTKYPRRRLDIVITVSYDSDLEKIKKTLIEIAQSHPFSDKQPAAKVIALKLGETSVEIRLSVWVKKQHYTELQEALHEKIKAADLQIPHPEMTIHLSQPVENVYQ
jgi:small-conductance mechanosensitive channel